jgi:hypothetical protein
MITYTPFLPPFSVSSFLACSSCCSFPHSSIRDSEGLSPSLCLSQSLARSCCVFLPFKHLSACNDLSDILNHHARALSQRSRPPNRLLNSGQPFLDASLKMSSFLRCVRVCARSASACALTDITCVLEHAYYMSRNLKAS